MARRGFWRRWTRNTSTLEHAVVDLDSHWEILDDRHHGEAVPSCAATHPTLDVLLDLRHQERFTASDVESVEVEVDSMTPRLLIYDRPTTGLEGKFSMPFCAAAAITYGDVGTGTFEGEHVHAEAIQALLPKVTMRANAAFDSKPPLSQSRVTLRLRDGRVLTKGADGARGYPGRPASDDQLAAKFSACARRSIPSGVADTVWTLLTGMDAVDDVSTLTAILSDAGSTV